MNISTKGQYALQVMLDLAVHDNGEYITIKSIAKRQNLSEKYLEQIIQMLVRAEYVKSSRGAKGGYRLTNSPKYYTVGMILRTTEGCLAPLRCIEDERECNQPEKCALCDLWSEISAAINRVVDETTLADLAHRYLQTTDYSYMI